MRVGPGLAALFVALAAAAACREPVPPPVAAPPPRLDAGDLAVMKALIDSVRRGATPPENAVPATSGLASEPHVLIVDTTLAVCDRDPRVFGTPPGGCLGPEWVAQVTRVLPQGSARTGTMAFENRNRRRLPIQGSLGAGVTPISATLIDGLAESALLREHPPGSAVVTISVPAYPAPRTAAVAYSARQGEAGAARLEQTADGRWSVVATR